MDQMNTDKIEGLEYHNPIISYTKKAFPFVVGGVFVLILMTIYFFKVLTPRYEKNLEAAVHDKQTVIDNLKLKELSSTNNTRECTTNCVDQIYNWENVQEFYSIKLKEKEWIKFGSNKVGIEFEYPIESNKLVLFEFNEWPKQESDPSGIEYSWSTRELGTEYGNDNFAWGSSSDLKIGRMSVDIYKWVEKDGNYFIQSAGGNQYEVEKLLVKDTPFGTQALFYKSPCFFFCNNSSMRSPDQNILIINLPYHKRPGIESILFGIPDNFSNEDLERIISSVKLTVD